MTKPQPAPRTVLHDSLSQVEETLTRLQQLVPSLRHKEDTAPAERRHLAHATVAQVEISVEMLRGVAARLDAAKALAMSSDAPPLA